MTCDDHDDDDDDDVLQGCRVPAVEGLLLSQTTPKKIILVLNKIDLVPAEVVRQVRSSRAGAPVCYRTRLFSVLFFSCLCASLSFSLVKGACCPGAVDGSLSLSG
jgi:hypothetical protein